MHRTFNRRTATKVKDGRVQRKNRHGPIGVFMHELGHHFDRIHQKHHDSSKGEDYAERFATSRFEQLFPAYIRVFGHHARED